MRWEVKEGFIVGRREEGCRGYLLDACRIGCLR